MHAYSNFFKLSGLLGLVIASPMNYTRPQCLEQAGSTNSSIISKPFESIERPTSAPSSKFPKPGDNQDSVHTIPGNLSPIGQHDLNLTDSMQNTNNNIHDPIFNNITRLAHRDHQKHAEVQRRSMDRNNSWNIIPSKNVWNLSPENHVEDRPMTEMEPTTLQYDIIAAAARESHMGVWRPELKYALILLKGDTPDKLVIGEGKKNAEGILDFVATEVALKPRRFRYKSPEIPFIHCRDMYGARVCAKHVWAEYQCALKAGPKGAFQLPEDAKFDFMDPNLYKEFKRKFFLIFT